MRFNVRETREEGVLTCVVFAVHEAVRKESAHECEGSAARQARRVCTRVRCALCVRQGVRVHGCAYECLEPGDLALELIVV